jgi:hypothetical protein
MLAQIVNHLVVNTLSRAPKRQFAQGCEISSLQEIVSGSSGVIGKIDLAFL